MKMQLGIIAKPTKENFSLTKRRGLDFLEFCINKGDDVDGFYLNRHDLKKWKREYDIGIGSIGRWKAKRINSKGNIIKEELEKCYKLIDVASELECANFISGCNYVEELSYYENCSAAIDFFAELINYAKPKGVNISSYNCRKVNFVHNPEAWKVIHGHLHDLGIKYDPSHSQYFEGDYLQETVDWGHRFNHIHLKGALMVNGQRIDDPPAGLDQTDWKKFISILRAKDYKAGLSIEPHSQIWTGELGEKGIDYTIDYMREIIL